MPNYAPSTRTRIGDLITGMRIDSTVLANLTYFHQDQWEVFSVYGRIMVLQLFWEAITVNGAGASLFQYNLDSEFCQEVHLVFSDISEGTLR